jgi:alpha-L-rhamnosidase
LILEGFTYGDWLALDGENEFDRLGGTDNGFIMSVYYYHSVELLN